MKIMLIFLLIGAATVSSYRSGKVMGGEKIKIKQVPYQVGILLAAETSNGRITQHLCGGSIVSPSFVLTAGIFSKVLIINNFNNA